MFKRIGLFLLLICLPAFSLLLLFPSPASYASLQGSQVIISEVAWAGTGSGLSADEWVELYNPTDVPIDVTGWTLNDGGDIDLTLIGTLPANGFYLLERTDDTVISDIVADQIYVGSLLNSGETLSLHDSSGVLVDTANSSGGGWDAGTSSPAYASMERLSETAPDLPDQWADNDGVTRNGLNANGDPINGTPKQPNSVWDAGPPPIAGIILINAVYYDGYVTGDWDEAVQLINASVDATDLTGWSISDGGSSRAIIPAGTILMQGETIWLARQATAFAHSFGFLPDLEVDDSHPAVPNLTGSWPGYANSGDEVVLFNQDDVLQDVLVYEGGDTSHSGWSGGALMPYSVGSSAGSNGQILYRKWGDMGNLPISDTNTAADWAQDSQDTFYGRKVRYPGWDLETFFLPPTIEESATITLAIAPDNAYEAIVHQIDRATNTIHIESLTFEHVGIMNALKRALQRGVSVTVLLEGGPSGGIEDQEKHICQELEALGGQCWFMISNDANDIYDRYSYLHAKFILIDDTWAIVSSENLSPNSLPDDDKSDGTWGRRGVILITDAPTVVAHIQNIFTHDFDPTDHADLFRWQAEHSTYGAPPAAFQPITTTGGITYTVRYIEPMSWSGTFNFEVIQSPENSIRPDSGLLGLLANVGNGDTILGQQLNEPPYWGSADNPNLRLEALIDAARRGATVELLLDDYFARRDDVAGNYATCAYLTNIARTEHIDITCALGNPTGLGVHNKMFLVNIDGQGTIHIGSLNGTELSHKGNRELALQVQSNEAYDLLSDIFQRDFPHRLYFPIAFNSYQGSTPHVLISEVLYNPSGTDEAEFIELVNPTSFPLDISNYSIGDAVYPTDFEDVRRFPAGTIIQPYQTLVIAQNGTAFNGVFGFNPHFELENSDAGIPDLIDDPAWGDPDAHLRLGNNGDEVILRNPQNGVVDVVVYGTGAYPNHPVCPLVESVDNSLERFPYWRDTNNCPVDFRSRFPASPNQLP